MSAIDHATYATILEGLRGIPVEFRGETWYIHHMHEGKANLFHPTSRHAFLNVPQVQYTLLPGKRIDIPRCLGRDEYAQERVPRGTYAIGVCVVCGARTQGTKGNGPPKTCSRECFRALPR